MRANDLIGLNENELIYNLANYFPSETNLLCGEVQESPGITHDLAADFKEEELPSSILFAKGLLHGIGIENYNRLNFVELNRGFASAIALRQVLLGGERNYRAFVRGQATPIALSKEQFEALHQEYNERLNSDELKIAAIYMAAFNDVGKATKLLREASLIKGGIVLDHDEANAIISNHPLKRQELLPGLDALNKKIRTLICQSVGLDFNPSCFTQGEYPLYPMTQIATSLSKAPTETQEGVFSLIKIESAMDVAGVRGHQAPGGAAYNKFVHPAFDLAFNKLAELIKGKSALEVYLDYIELNYRKIGFSDIDNQYERVSLTRIALMIRANSVLDRETILEAYENLKNKYPDAAKCLINELAINNLDASSTSVWMQYSPDLLRILTKENKSGQTPAEGLLLGLRIYAQVLTLARQQAIDAPCHMVQGREIIPITRKAANGDNEALLLLKNAADYGVELNQDVVNFKEIKEISEEMVSNKQVYTESAITLSIFSPPRNSNTKPVVPTSDVNCAL